MIKICTKAGVAQLSLFEKSNFEYYEAYISGKENLPDLLNTKMRLFGIHMPANVNVGDKITPVDFCDDGQIGENSFKKLRELIVFAENNDVKYIVVHPGFYNSITQKQEVVTIELARKFKKMLPPKVKICIENVCCWTNICFENEPILSSLEQISFFKKLCPEIGFVLDTDHLAIDIVFKEYYHLFKERYKGTKINDDIRKEMEEYIRTSVQEDPEKLKKIISNELSIFMREINPKVVHAVGSDFENYFLAGSRPLGGEGLPLNYKGKIRNFEILDKIDHLSWIKYLREDSIVTLELHIRDDYDYVETMEENKKFIAESYRTASKN